MSAETCAVNKFSVNFKLCVSPQLTVHNCVVVVDFLTVVFLLAVVCILLLLLCCCYFVFEVSGDDEIVTDKTIKKN